MAVVPPKPDVTPPPEPEQETKPDIALERQPPKPIKTPVPKKEEPPKPVKPTKLPEATKPPEPVKKEEPPKKQEVKPQAVKMAPNDFLKKLRDEEQSKESANALQGLRTQVQAREAGDANSRLNQYIAGVNKLIHDKMHYPEDDPSNLEVDYKVKLLPDMTILVDQVELAKSSGNRSFDEAVKRAIIAIGQFPPIPPGAGFKFDLIRNSTIKYHLHEK